MPDSLHAKILLFGEYSILAGSHALTIPFAHFGGHFNYLSRANDHRLAVASNQFLKEYLHFLKQESTLKDLINTEVLEEHLQYGLFFDSNIPLGYGLGSSGAVVSGIFKSYGNKSAVHDLMKPDNWDSLKNILALMESFHHGKSSGIDPLSIALNTPLLLYSDKIKAISNIAENIGVAVYDLGFKSETQHLVNDFMHRYQTESDYKTQVDEYSLLVNKCIDEVIKDKSELFFEHMRNISRWQLKLFEKMLPKSAQEIIEDGLNSGTFYAKLCGSGGGGYLLLFYNKIIKTPTQLTYAIEVM